MGEQRPVHRPRRSPHGERGLKFFRSRVINAEVGRSPHGERGLKFTMAATVFCELPVALLMESVD